MKHLVITNLKDGSLVITIDGIVFKMVYVHAGTYLKGPKDRKWPETITNDFLIGEIPVTEELYRAVISENTSSNSSQRPVVNKSWDEFCEFINKINRITHLSFRLPSEAEWEYAARGGHKGKGYIYAGSNKLSDVAYFHKESDKGHCLYSVKLYKPNELGCYDMTGNVDEIVSDMAGNEHIIKGGAWYNLMKERFDPGITWTTNKVCERGIGIRLALS